MRKLLSKSAVLTVLAAAVLTVTAFAATREGCVNVNALRLRSEPSTSSSTITYLSTGDFVEILDDMGEWYQVAFEGYTGYVFASYVSTYDTVITDAPVPLESLAGKTGVLTASEVNFRSGPSTDDAVLSSLSEGAQVTILSISGDWCRVDNGGQEGYVNADYLAVDGLPLVDPKGVVTGSCVNVRSIPSTEGSILTKVYAGATVSLLALEGDWYTVSVDGIKGYIRSDYIRIYQPGSSSGLGSDIVSKAYEFLGTRYAYGGASPKGLTAPALQCTYSASSATACPIPPPPSGRTAVHTWTVPTSRPVIWSSSAIPPGAMARRALMWASILAITSLSMPPPALPVT